MPLKPNLPCFYIDSDFNEQIIVLSDNEAKHASKSQRLKIGNEVVLSNGKGALALARIINITPSEVFLNIIEYNTYHRTNACLHIALSILSHPDRFEWFVEKATELSVHQITPLICSRTEKKNINLERLKRLAIAALKQSRNPFMPQINEPINIKKFIELQKQPLFNKYIATCFGHRTSFNQINLKKTSIFLIGPEGDFTEEELQYAKHHHFIPIMFETNTLRSETAALLLLPYLVI